MESKELRQKKLFLPVLGAEIDPYLHTSFENLTKRKIRHQAGL